VPKLGPTACHRQQVRRTVIFEAVYKRPKPKTNDKTRTEAGHIAATQSER